MKKILFVLFCTVLLVNFSSNLLTADSNSFIGNEACKDCHEKQYNSFMKHSKKAHSYKSIEIMLPQLTEEEIKECFKCHTMGYGQPGGFVSAQSTPNMKNPGCESCHGMGKLHAESGDPKLINAKGKIDVNNCKSCHNESRVNNFNFKPMLYSGGH